MCFHTKPALLLTLLLSVTLFACEPTNQGYAPQQPVEYSHAVHAGAQEIPCQYCHFAAERGRYAGIPPAQICMNCHDVVKRDHPEIQKVRNAIESGEPIAWLRVNMLPDHAYFNHSVHVSSANIQCQDCHGQVESMSRVEQWAPLTMGWCVDCHREKAPELDSTRASQLVDCVSCHH